MIWDEIKKIDSGIKKLREFGFLVGGVLAALGLLFWWRGKGHFPYFLFPGVFLIVAGAVLPVILKPFQKIWMILAVLLGWVMTRVILTVLFFFAVTPIGIILRITGKDLLGLRLEPRRPSYWKPKPPDTHTPSDYERQF